MGGGIAFFAMHSDAYVLTRNNTVTGEDPRGGFRNCVFVSKCSANRRVGRVRTTRLLLLEEAGAWYDRA